MDDVKRFLAGEMSPEELEAWHVDNPSSQAALSRISLPDLVGLLPTFEITDEMLAAYVDGDLSDSDRATVDASMAIDPVVAAHVRELYALRTELSTFTLAGPRPRASLWSRFTARRSVWSSTLVASAAVLVVAVLISIRSGTKAPASQDLVATRNPPPPSALSPRVIAIPETKPKQPVEQSAPEVQPPPKKPVVKAGHVAGKPRQNPNPSPTPGPTPHLNAPSDSGELRGLPAMRPPDEPADALQDLTRLSTAETTVSDKPTLHWKGLADAVYSIKITGSEGVTFAVESDLTEPNYTVKTPLKAGQPYRWVVTATKDGKPIGRGRGEITFRDNQEKATLRPGGL